MNFRSVSDLFAAVRRNIHKVPPDVDLVVGVPRSGMLAATAVSLAIHKPLIDLNGFLAGQPAWASTRRGMRQPNLGAHYKSVLIVDDSIYLGSSILETRKRIEAAKLDQRFTYAAIFGLDTSHPEVDMIFETCPIPRVFEWNVMNHWALEFACVDLDGVICADPTMQENDDGSCYLEFLRSATLLNKPSGPIMAIVTSRLEKYRPQTENWLKQNEINYKSLFMLDLPSAEERRRLGAHAKFKADVFKQKKDSILFIESETHQAMVIREISGKSVLAYKDMQFFPENVIFQAKRRARNYVGALLPPRIKRFLKTALKP